MLRRSSAGAVSTLRCAVGAVLDSTPSTSSRCQGWPTAPIEPHGPTEGDPDFPPRHQPTHPRQIEVRLAASEAELLPLDAAPRRAAERGERRRAPEEEAPVGGWVGG
ncbi:hypothetical protein GUJ93_ZPchr0009g282 [Zizania palustris]|uniref:Uncharacterized protein n=1 Tax=Zizania palustris TaxID=103762 RepID=A0A8J5RJL1_ZIZPA|nr:hypothetical protein GUJ93_ZPchr0009g282 [Zizania palustris]